MEFQALEIVALQKPVKPADRHTLSPAVKLCDGGGGVRSLRQVEALATAVGAHHMTNSPIMTRVALEEVLLAEFECDTAASHSVISAELFKQLQWKLGRTLIGKKENVAVKLADGSVSSKSYGSIQLKVRAHRTAPVKVTFFVLEGPNNLLGRYTLEQLWPVEYKALRDVAVSIGSSVSVSVQ